MKGFPLMDNESRVKNDSASPSEQQNALSSVDTQHAKDNINQISAMLEAEENAGAQAGETTEKIKSVGFKGLVAATAATSVMGISSLLQVDKAPESAPPPTEPTPIEELVETNKPVINLEQEGTEGEQDVPAEKQERIEKTTIQSQVEKKPITWWHDVPAISQQDLTYNGRETDYGCAPTAVSMVTEYWHAQDSSNETRSAQELLDANVEQGVFKGTGMSITNIHDELSALGYETKDYADADLETLKREVAKGPVVAVVKLGMGTEGTPHSVVVTGISENNEVRVNDPWDGESRTYRWETFSRSWSAKFGDVSSRNHFAVIRPS
jgi:predicted double-glycine peptidase